MWYLLFFNMLYPFPKYRNANILEQRAIIPYYYRNSRKCLKYIWVPSVIILAKNNVSVCFFGKDEDVCFVFTGVVKRIIPAVASTNAVIAGMLKETGCYFLLISPLLYWLWIFVRYQFGIENLRRTILIFKWVKFILTVYFILFFFPWRNCVWLSMNVKLMYDRERAKAYESGENNNWKTRYISLTWF